MKCFNIQIIFHCMMLSGLLVIIYYDSQFTILIHMYDLNEFSSYYNISLSLILLGPLKL